MVRLPRKFAAIAEALGEHISGLDQRQAAQAAITAVRHINADLGIPAKLGDVGVDTARIPTMARIAMQSGNIAVNPRKTSQRDLEILFQQAI